jgi:general stress protein 26
MHSGRGTKAILGAALFALCIVGFAVQVMAQEATAVPRDTLLAVAKDIMAQTRFCVLITLDEAGHPRARAMDPFMPDENWVIWMGTGPMTRKAKDIKKDPRVTLYYDHPAKAGYVVVYGTAKLVDDPGLKEKWFKEEWAQFYQDKEKEYVLISVTPKKIEVLDYTKGVMGDETTWVPPSVTF